MAIKINPIQFVNYNGTSGSVVGTYSLVDNLGKSYQMMKRETVEACVVINAATIPGSGNLNLFVDEFVNGNWIPVGTTGSITATATAVIDSSGGTSSTGSTTFSSSSNLRLLGKGTDTRIRATYSGTAGTVAFTADFIGYLGG